MRGKKLHKIFRGNGGIEHDFPEGYECPQGIRCLRRPRFTARRNWDQACSGSPPEYVHAQREQQRAAQQCTSVAGHASSQESTSGTLETLFYRDSTATETPPRGVQSPGSYRDPQSSHWTSASNETRVALYRSSHALAVLS